MPSSPVNPQPNEATGKLTPPEGEAPEPPAAGAQAAPAPPPLNKPPPGLTAVRSNRRIEADDPDEPQSPSLEFFGEMRRPSYEERNFSPSTPVNSSAPRPIAFQSAMNAPPLSPVCTIQMPFIGTPPCINSPLVLGTPPSRIPASDSLDLELMGLGTPTAGYSASRRSPSPVLGSSSRTGAVAPVPCTPPRMIHRIETPPASSGSSNNMGGVHRTLSPIPSPLSGIASPSRVGLSPSSPAYSLPVSALQPT